MRQQRILVIVTLALFPSFASASLTWDQRERSFDPRSGEKQVVAEYRFTNSGDKAITIKPSGNDCDCTIAKLSKDTYQTGESGMITATFILGQRIGLQEKTILVTTDDPKEKQVTLKLKVNLPEPVELSPRLVYWQTGEAATTKSVRLKIKQDKPVLVKSVSSSLPDVKTQLKTIEAGREYEILVTPLSTAKPLTSVLEIQSDLPANQAWALRLYARVINPQRTGAAVKPATQPALSAAPAVR